MDEHKEQEAISLLKIIYDSIEQIMSYIYLCKKADNYYITNIEKNTLIKLDCKPCILKTSCTICSIQFNDKKLIAFINDIEYRNYLYRVFELEDDNLVVVYNYINTFSDSAYVDIVDTKQQKVIAKYRITDCLSISDKTIEFCDFSKNHFEDKDIKYDRIILNIKREL